MINQENLNKIYEGVIDGKELTTKELNSYGFNSKDLADLIDNRILERVSRGKYSLVDFDGLYKMGKHLISLKQFDGARTCFEKCHELDPSHYDTCLQLFFRSVHDSDYDKAFEYFDNFYVADNVDHIFYLYLLSMFAEVPEKYRELARSIGWSNVVVNDSQHFDYEVHNRIRSLALNEKFSYAIRYLNGVMLDNECNCFEYSIIKLLLNQAAHVQIENKTNLVDMINNNNYEEAASFLRKKHEFRSLSRFDYYTLVLLEKLMIIKENSIIPEKKNVSVANIFEAIDAENYELALSYMVATANERNLSNDQNCLYLVLVKINDEIKQLNNLEDKQIVQDSIDLKDCNAEIKKEHISSGYMDVLNYLMKQDLDNAFNMLRNYLDSIGKREYEFLIVDLIKISCIEKDIAYSKPMITLTYLSKGKFEFNVSEYVQDFYLAISQNKFNEAKVYLDIISKSKSIIDSGILVDVLEQALENLEGIDQKNSILENPTEVTTVVIDDIVEEEMTDMISDSIIPGCSDDCKLEPSHTCVKKKSSTTVNQDVQAFNNDVAFIHEKLSDVYSNGIVLLKPMTYERISRIYKIVADIPDVVCFKIGDADNKRLVLKHKVEVEDIDIKQLIMDAKEAFKNKQYQTAIDINKELVIIGHPKTFIYANLGLAYLHNFDRERAIECLTIATEISKKEDNSYNFTELLYKLENNHHDENDKPYVEFSPYEFIDDMYDYYNVPNMDQIIELVANGSSIDDACSYFDLTDEDINIVYLIFAKRCYAEQRYNEGDKYLKKVEHTKNKTEFVKKLRLEVQTNKKFYKNRVEVLASK